VTRPPDIRWASAAQRRRYVAAARRVERRLESSAGRMPGTMGAAAAATLQAGGKRLRPFLVLLCCNAARRLPPHATRVAAAVELLHTATLVHDDVLDGAELRRGRPTVVSEWGPAVATSVGNYLFAAAFAEVVAVADPRAVARLSTVAAGLSEGELLQMNEAHNVDLTPAAYLRRCRLKTGGLFGASCALGALVSGLPEGSVAALDEYGCSLGLAFQIFDDILDLSGEPARTGKQSGTDVRDGTVTLPLIYAVEEHPDLAARLAVRDKDEELVAEIQRSVRRGAAPARARETALGFIAEARDHLDRCGGEIEVDLLRQIAGRVVDRYS